MVIIYNEWGLLLGWLLVLLLVTFYSLSIGSYFSPSRTSHGHVHPSCSSVQFAFESNFIEGLETGASFSAYGNWNGIIIDIDIDIPIDIPHSYWHFYSPVNN